MRRLKGRQHGLTLLEVLIAISIFAVIGVASYRVLSTVILTQQQGDRYSAELSQLQKALVIIDNDLQQLVNREVRQSPENSAPSLMVNYGDSYVLEFTRGGRSNPLKLARSQLQRVAYDIGPHPKANDKSSAFYQNEQLFLRRHYWHHLDSNLSQADVTQALLGNVDQLTPMVITNKGTYKQWPGPKRQTEENAEPESLKAIEVSFGSSSSPFGLITRTYRVN